MARRLSWHPLLNVENVGLEDKREESQHRYRKHPKYGQKAANDEIPCTHIKRSVCLLLPSKTAIALALCQLTSHYYTTTSTAPLYATLHQCKVVPCCCHVIIKQVQVKNDLCRALFVPLPMHRCLKLLYNNIYLEISRN